VTIEPSKVAGIYTLDEGTLSRYERRVLIK
jgi:hypothetical protein